MLSTNNQPIRCLSTGRFASRFLIHKKLPRESILSLQDDPKSRTMNSHGKGFSDLEPCGSGGRQVDRFGKPPGRLGCGLWKRNGSEGVKMCPKGCDAKTPRLSTWRLPLCLAPGRRAGPAAQTAFPTHPHPTPAGPHCGRLSRRRKRRPGASLMDGAGPPVFRSVKRCFSASMHLCAIRISGTAPVVNNNLWVILSNPPNLVAVTRITRPGASSIRRPLCGNSLAMQAS